MLKINEKLSLEISLKMITLCERIDLAKYKNQNDEVSYYKEKLGELVFKAMKDCPF